MHLSNVATLALAAAATGQIPEDQIDSKFNRGGHIDGSRLALHHCLDMYQTAVYAVHEEPQGPHGDWTDLSSSLGNYDYSTNNDRFNCSDAKTVFEDGKKHSSKSRTAFMHKCMPALRAAADTESEWAHCSLVDNVGQGLHAHGYAYIGWSPAGSEFCSEAKDGEESIGTCPDNHKGHYQDRRQIAVDFISRPRTTMQPVVDRTARNTTDAAVLAKCVEDGAEPMECDDGGSNSNCDEMATGMGDTISATQVPTALVAA